MEPIVLPGAPYPLGATFDGKGTNFAIFSENAEKVELCLFETEQSRAEFRRIPLTEQTDLIWHCYVRDIIPGQLYGYRVYGPHDPANGMRFNHHKVLLDPYAKAIGRAPNWDDALFGYRIGDPAADLSFDERDSAAHAPLGVVVDPAFSWGDDRPPRTPWHDTVIYEVHVKGFSILNPLVPDKLRGTYAGMASPESIAYLRDLGVTAVELMPVHHHVDARHLVERNLTNYWGYDTLSFFAPHLEYASATLPRDAVREFKTMVASLHAAGIEVILDVVYNHTAEGNHMGPTLSLRGIDNPSYYRLVEGDRRYYMDYTGCGNTLNMTHPRVLQLIMDSLRYWITEMRVDGFRFDLASALARELHEVDRLGAFFDIIRQDPVISQTKLIAEPWDLGEGGYQVGNFPVGWTEWNGRYRDTVRAFWKGDEGTASELATRLCGSSDLYERSGRRPVASINFITAHDGFTLHDLVSYNEKHNEANGEDNRDGESNNRAWNCGVEGPTDDPHVNDLRERQKRNFLAFLLISQGVPMLLAGDESGRTQHGNNNAYCQDNEVSWLDWNLDERRKALLEFARRVIHLRRRHPTFRRRKFFQGRLIRGLAVKDLTWLRPDGAEMSDQEWSVDWMRTFGVLLGGGDTDQVDEAGHPVPDATFLVLLNAHHEPLEFRLIPPPRGGHWEIVIDTARPELEDEAVESAVELRDRSLMILRHVC